MRFRTENQLVEHSAPLLQASFQSEAASAYVEREVGAGRNIADLVLLLQAPGAIPPEISALTTGESVVLSALRRHGATRIDILEQRCGLSRTELRVGALDRLLRWGLVRKERGGRIALESNYVRNVQIVAVEAKLTRWRQALRQAVEYFRYADLSYVLLPESSGHVALENAEAFRSVGVGLLLASTGSLSTAISSRPSDRHDWRREFVLSRLLKHEVRSLA